MACRILARVLAEMVRLWLKAYETVLRDTPARAATSEMVGFFKALIV
jgi:hypothetical protein